MNICIPLLRTARTVLWRLRRHTAAWTWARAVAGSNPSHFVGMKLKSTIMVQIFTFSSIYLSLLRFCFNLIYDFQTFPFVYLQVQYLFRNFRCFFNLHNYKPTTRLLRVCNIKEKEKPVKKVKCTEKIKLLMHFIISEIKLEIFRIIVSH